MEKNLYFINLTFNSDTYEVGDAYTAKIDNPNYNTKYLSDILVSGLDYETGCSYYLDGYISNNKFYVQEASMGNEYDDDSWVKLSNKQFGKIAKILIKDKVIVNKIKENFDADISKIEYNKIKEEAEEAGRIFGIDVSNTKNVSEFTYLALKYIYNKSQFGWGASNSSKKNFINGVQKFINECA